MAWSKAHIEKSHRSVKHRQASADRKALPLIERLRRHGCTYRHIAHILNKRTIPPPAAYTKNEFFSGSGWSPTAVLRICKRHSIKSVA